MKSKALTFLTLFVFCFAQVASSQRFKMFREAVQMFPDSTVIVDTTRGILIDCRIEKWPKPRLAMLITVRRDSAILERTMIGFYNEDPMYVPVGCIAIFFEFDWSKLQPTRKPKKRK